MEVKMNSEQKRESFGVSKNEFITEEGPFDVS